MKVSELFAFALVAAYNLTILGGCAFLVWHGWSAWWFLLAVLLLAGQTSDNKEKAP